MGLFDKLKKNSGNNGKSFQKQLENQGQGGFKKDPRIWKQTYTVVPNTNDKQYISINKIRFLPIPMKDMELRESGGLPEGAVLTPVACIVSHFFEGVGGRYIENSLATFNETCPVRTHDQPLWKKQKESNDKQLKEILMDRLPNNDYYANILVIDDQTTPENNGKVFLFKFGNGIKKILDAAPNPLLPTDPKVEDPYDPWVGADLDFNIVGEKSKFKGKEVIKPDYSKIAWCKPSIMCDGDEAEIERIWSETHSLMDFYNRSEFKTYEELEAKFKKCMGIPQDAPLTAGAVGSYDDQSVDRTPPPQGQLTADQIDQEEAATPKTEAETPKVEAVVDNSSADDDLDEFERMMKEAENS